jgi:hypothetical protein
MNHVTKSYFAIVFTAVLVVVPIMSVIKDPNFITPSIARAQLSNKTSNSSTTGNPNSGLSSAASTYFTVMNGTIRSTQNNENGTWLLSGKWGNTLANILGHYESIFSASFNMVNANGSGMHNHTISGRIIGKPVTQNNITTISGPITVTLKDGPHSDVPSTIKFTDKSTISISLSSSKVRNHFGNTPILGTITKEQFFKSITEVIHIAQPPQSMIIG